MMLSTALPTSLFISDCNSMPLLLFVPQACAGADFAAGRGLPHRGREVIVLRRNGGASPGNFPQQTGSDHFATGILLDTDKPLQYASTTYEKVLPGPLYSRKDSAAGLSANAKTSLTSISTLDRHVDCNRKNSSRDATHGQDSVQNIAGSTIPIRPSKDRAKSPTSTRSGSHTPVQVAPTVPSMLPLARKPVSGQSTPMDTLNALRQQKASRAVHMSQGTKGSDTMEVRTMKAQIRALELVCANHKAELNQVKDISTEVAALKHTVEQQQEVLAKNSGLEELERRLGILENAKAPIEATQIGHLQTELEATKEAMKGLRSMHEKTNKDATEALEKSRKFDAQAPDVGAMIQTVIEPEIKKIKDHAEKTTQKLHDRVSKLNEAMGQLRRDQEVSGSIKDQTNSIKGELSSLARKHSTLSDFLQSLQSDHTKMGDQIKAFESKQSDLYKKCDTVSNHVGELRTEQESLASIQEALRTQQVRPDTLQALQSRVETTENLSSQLPHVLDKLSEISDRVTKLDENPQLATRHGSTSGHLQNADASSSDMRAILSRVASLEERFDGDCGLTKVIEVLQDDVERLQADMHGLKSDVDTASSQFTKVFAEHFDPFKASVERKLEIHSRDVKTHSVGLTTLQEQVAKACGVSSAPAFSDSEMLFMRGLIQEWPELTQDVNSIQASWNAQMEQLNTGVGDLKKQMTMKQDIKAATQAIDTVKAAVRNLQNQYDNISTDDLHQKMVHWFVQNYPGPTTTMLQQFAAVKHEVAQLQRFTDLITRIPNGVQALSALAQMGAPAELLSKTKDALASVTESVGKVQKQHESVAKTVSDIQSAIHTLKSNDTPLVRPEPPAATEGLVCGLRTEFEDRFRSEVEARNKLNDQRVQAECSIEISIRDLQTKVESLETEPGGFQKDIEGAIEDGTASKELEDLRTAVKELREIVIPENMIAVEDLPFLYVHVLQMQGFLEDLNQNMPGGAQTIEWTYDLKERYNLKPPHRTMDHTAAGKGKRKR
ncbi:hypothetical protein OPT61_g4363 [Boeremia exigua]|uniref:Uncharacterized protein n=1 Tax=Boeremia exigua TaxID=749465 RepID=A0ACC2IEC4_9PLEO|nr:hypothetical protein OPT61_g4363 [Boeremia exigua]